MTGNAEADEVRLKNGDRLTGKVITMEEGKLVFETTYAGKITIKWAEVSSLKTDKPIKVVLSDETALEGVPQPTEEEKMKLETDKIEEAVSFHLAEVKSINPKVKPAVKVEARANLGLSSTSGNTETENAYADGEFVARTEKNRYTVGAQYNRAEDEGEKTANRGLGYTKYDHFLTQKWFLYANASFETDEFQDLDLRTTLGTGVGYQVFETERTNLSLEAGPAYVDQNYDVAEDNDYPAGAWAINFDIYFFDKKVQFFHFDSGFISLEDTKDTLIRTRTGLRLPFYKDLNATIQYNWDRNNNPVPGKEKVDEMLIFSLGYQFKN